MLQDQVAQRRRRRANQGGVFADAIERPVGVTPVGWRACVFLHLVVCLPFAARVANALAIHSPLANTSTARPVSRTSALARAKRLAACCNNACQHLTRDNRSRHWRTRHSAARTRKVRLAEGLGRWAVEVFEDSSAASSPRRRIGKLVGQARQCISRWPRSTRPGYGTADCVGDPDWRSMISTPTRRLWPCRVACTRPRGQHASANAPRAISV